MPPTPFSPSATALTHAHTHAPPPPPHLTLETRPGQRLAQPEIRRHRLLAYSPVSRLVRQPLCVVMPCMIMPAAASIARRPLAISFVRISIVSLKPSGLKPKSPASRSPLSRPAVVATPLITERRCEGERAVNSCAGTRGVVGGKSIAQGHCGLKRPTFDDSEEGERGGDVVRVFSPHIPEHIHLRLALALRESRHAAAALHKEHAHRSEHGHPRVLQLRLAHPVEISPDALDLAQAERVEASVARERAVELLRLIEERQGLGLGRERHRRPRRRLHRRGESHRGGEHQRGHESSEARHAAVRLRIGGEGGQVGEVQKERCRLLETRTLATHAVRSRC
mmetsp:Transcript_34710/g.92494  ORF Transcript_34710/g.92494 Transcript_34710/m.92494 type:complete len:338 (+) Transcript_34710:113-1126(+)